MIENQYVSNGNSSLGESEKHRNGMEVGLIDIFRNIIDIRKTIYKAVGIGMLVGIIVALSIPKQYTVKVTLSPEMGSSKGGNGLAGLAASFLGSGASLGENLDALNASLSSDIVASTPFLLELLRMKIGISSAESNNTLEAYLGEQSSPWWNYVITMPGIIISGVKALFTNENNIITIGEIKKTTIELTREETDKISSLRKAITASVNNKTAITSISVTLQDPEIAAIVADSVIHKLQEYIIKARIYNRLLLNIL